MFHLLHSLLSLQSFNISIELLSILSLLIPHVVFCFFCAIMPCLCLGKELSAVLTELAICFPNYNFEMNLC